MANFKDLLIKGLYCVDCGAIHSESWGEMMIDNCGHKVEPHLDYIQPFSLMLAYKKAGTNVSLKHDLLRELSKLKMMSKAWD